jgi:hypothetical protein
MAAAGATTLVRPAAGLADTLTTSRPVFSVMVGSLAGESRPILARRTFALAGVEWSGPRTATIELRARTSDGRWTPWVPASTLGHDPDRTVNPEALFGEPVWTGPARCVQLRADRRVHDVRVHFVSVDVSASVQAARVLPRAQPVLPAGPGQPPIIARSAWAHGTAPPANGPMYGTVKLAFVHHTVSANGYGAAAVPSLLHGIYAFHRYVRGWWDIGYNFVIDAYGRIWEARAGGIDMAVLGAQAGGYNAESTGVAMLGDFMSVVPSRAAINALQHLLAWKLSLHGLPATGRANVVVDPAAAFYTPFAPGAHVSLPRIAGHRDGDTTDCPGNALYHRLRSIRLRVVALAGAPARLTISEPLAAVTAGSANTFSGQLAMLTGAPLAGAPIEIQSLGAPVNGTRAYTFETVTTASDGSWSTSLTFAENVILRALHRDAPASVSDWILLTVTPAITLTVQSTNPLLLSGTVNPAKPRVFVDLYPPTRTTGKPLRRVPVPVAAGAFSATLNPPGPGDYQLVARTKADAVNGAGASAPLPVTIS